VACSRIAVTLDEAHGVALANHVMYRLNTCDWRGLEPLMARLRRLLRLAPDTRADPAEEATPTLSPYQVPSPGPGTRPLGCSPLPDRGVSVPDRGVSVPDRGVSVPDRGVSVPQTARMLAAVIPDGLNARRGHTRRLGCSPCQTRRGVSPGQRRSNRVEPIRPLDDLGDV
jgi:hypothetical protein